MAPLAGNSRKSSHIFLNLLTLFETLLSLTPTIRAISAIVIVSVHFNRRSSLGHFPFVCDFITHDLEQYAEAYLVDLLIGCAHTPHWEA